MDPTVLLCGTACRGGVAVVLAVVFAVVTSRAVRRRWVREISEAWPWMRFRPAVIYERVGRWDGEIGERTLSLEPCDTMAELRVVGTPRFKAYTGRPGLLTAATFGAMIERPLTEGRRIFTHDPEAVDAWLAAPGVREALERLVSEPRVERVEVAHGEAISVYMDNARALWDTPRNRGLAEDLVALVEGAEKS